jgi:hypothetical protein
MEEVCEKNDENKTHSCFIYHNNIADVQKDSDITQYLLNYDKNFVRESMPPCIHIIYTNDNYLKLKEVLKTKYSIELLQKKKNIQYIQRNTTR